MREFVKLWERILFAEDGEAVSWEKSFDDGQTWEAWPGKPPFIRLENLDQVESVAIEYRVPKLTVNTIRELAKQLKGGVLPGEPGDVLTVCVACSGSGCFAVGSIPCGQCGGSGLAWRKP